MMEEDKTIETFSAEDTFELGRRMGEKAHSGEVVCLTGDLGTGKTIFAKGFAAGLGIDEPVVSPTFTIVQEYYGGRLPLSHFDVYRIADPAEMEETGYDDYLFGDCVCLIEWAELIEELIPRDSIFVEIAKDPEKGFDYRRVSIRNLSGVPVI